MDNRRKTIVINKKFQYQYSLLVAAAAVLLVNSFFIVRILFPGDVPLDIPTPSFFAIGIIELALVAGIWYFSLRASHRVAGPVYVFSRELQRLGQGDLSAYIDLREKDMFQSEANDINASIRSLRSKVVSLQAIAAELTRAQAEGGDLSALVAQLESELASFTTGKED